MGRPRGLEKLIAEPKKKTVSSTWKAGSWQLLMSQNELLSLWAKQVGSFDVPTKPDRAKVEASLEEL